MDDAGEIHAFGRSLRQESTVWSRGADDVFSRSSRDEDDEEALRWAALEKLPTYDRARTAVLAMPEGELKEVNVHKLGAQEKHALMQCVAWVGDEHERFLSKFKDRVDRVGVELPTIEVRYQNLNMEAEAYVGSRGLPTIPNTYANVLEVLNAYVIRHALELDVNVGTSLLDMYCKCGVTASAEAMFATMPLRTGDMELYDRLVCASSNIRECTTMA